MDQHTQQRGSSDGPLSAIAFNILMILMSPVTLVGYILWIGGIVRGRRSGVSATAQGPLSARYTQHHLGTRQDEAASRLMTVVPTVSPFALSLTSAPMFLAHRLTGYVPKAYRYPFEGPVAAWVEASARQTFFDNVVLRQLSTIKQFVVLGAGFDTRAFGLPADLRVRSFEVDAPKTQAVKRDMLQKAGIDSAAVTFVSASFQTEDWFSKLLKSGFDPARPALYIWEGVTMYLDRESVHATLRKIAGSAKGSMVAFDYYTTEPLTSSDLFWRYGRMGAKAAGEPLTFGFDSTPPSRDRLAEFLASCGLSLGEQHVLGEETGGKRAWGGFATAVVQ